MLRTIPALTVGVLALLWSAVALADVTVKLSPGVSKALQDAAAQPNAGDTKPASEDEINEGVNHALKELAKHPTDAKIRDAAKRLLDSGQTIRILCREEAAKEAEQDKSLKEALDQSSQDALGGGGATLGDFDKDGKPRPGGTARIVIECASLGTHGLFGDRGVLGSITALLGHELVHASHKDQRHGPDDTEADRAWYESFGTQFATPFRERFDAYREEKARAERKKKKEREKQERDKQSEPKQTGMAAPLDSGAYVLVSPGLIHITAPGGNVGYQWGAQGGYLLRTNGLFAIGVGGSFEHALATGSAAQSSFASHQLRAQAEALPGVALLDGRLFVHGAVALGYLAWPQRSTVMDMTTHNTGHGVALSVGAGVLYAVWRGLVIGAAVGGDLQWLPTNGQSFAAHTVDIEATIGWLF